MVDKENGALLVLGIDTGGTYTDGVLLEYETKVVQASTKTLTTRDDLAKGISQAIHNLALDDTGRIGLVSISTTLATNSIVEGKGRRVGLILIGYDPEMVSAFNLAARFATHHFYYFRGGHDVYGEEKERLDLEAIVARVKHISGQVDALAISSYFSPLNPEHEEAVLAAIKDVTDLPVVLGHQLSTALDSVQRATTATLNASLLGILADFIKAVRRAMEIHSINAPLMVVKGDGTLMSAETAARRPVETVLSGPAASAIGGKYLSGVENAVVVDIGGTTTDMILIDDGQVGVTEEGAWVGGFRTAVKAANIRSIGLGGDSQISFDRDGKRLIGPGRVVPLCYLASEYPTVAEELLALPYKNLLDANLADLEYWFLLRRPERLLRDSEDMHKQVLSLIDEAPKSVSALTKRLGVLHPVQLGVDSLIRQGIIGKSSLTPTDLLHVNGEFVAWRTDVARVAMEMACKLTGYDAETFIQGTLDQMVDMICQGIVTFVGKQEHASLPPEIEDGYGQWFYRKAMDGTGRFTEATLRLKYPVIGIGAPAKIFLEAVAQRLRTGLILPPHFPVANAVGAVSGSVVSVQEALVYPKITQWGTAGYFVQTETERSHLPDLDAALSEARKMVSLGAEREALSGGAVAPRVDIEEVPDGVDSFRVRARAVGNPKIELLPKNGSYVPHVVAGDVA